MRNGRIDSAYFISARKLLTEKVVPSLDFHIHTNYTDGKATVKQVFEKAIEFGLEAIAFTEHTEKWRHTNSAWFSSYYSDILENRKLAEGKIKAYVGIEAPAITFEGDLEITQEMIEKSEFIIGAAHRYPEMGNKKVSELTKTEAIDLEYRTLLCLTNNKQIDAIAHIGATCTKYCTPFPKDLERDVIKQAVKNNIAIEINPVYHKPMMDFIEVCAEENAYLTLGSNAHGFNDIGMIARELKKIFNQ